MDRLYNAGCRLRPELSMCGPWHCLRIILAEEGSSTRLVGNVDRLGYRRFEDADCISKNYDVWLWVSGFELSTFAKFQYVLFNTRPLPEPFVGMAETWANQTNLVPSSS